MKQTVLGLMIVGLMASMMAPAFAEPKRQGSSKGNMRLEKGSKDEQRMERKGKEKKKGKKKKSQGQSKGIRS